VLLPQAGCVAALLGLLVSCAHQVPPGGGPDDRVPPSVAESVPAPGTVGCGRDAHITLTFSEWISPRTVEKSVTVFPPPAEGFRTKAAGRVLEIRPKGLLAESTTYHVEVTTGLQDLRGNPVATPFHLIFSTGSVLDSGEISGCIVDQNRNNAQPKIALFEVPREGSFFDTLLFGVPSYLAQTDTLGSFTLSHIRPGTYRLCAFTDNNNDNRLQPDREQVYVSTGRQVRLERRLGPLELYPVSCDTAARRVARFRPLSSTVMAGTWSRRVFPGPSGEKALDIVPLDSTVKVPRVRAYHPLGDGTRFVLVLSDTLVLAPYLLVYTAARPVARGDSVEFRDTVRFNGITAVDTVAPRLSGWAPKGKADLLSPLMVSWSEPVRLLDSVFHAVDTVGDTVVLEADSGFSDTTRLVPTERFRPGQRFVLTLPFGAVEDIAGNHPADTTDTAWYTIAIETIEEKIICCSMSGGASCLPPDPARRWAFAPFGSARTFWSGDSAGQFKFDSIPSGRGRLSYLIDTDGDGEVSEGSLIPWSAPEPYVVFPDTVEARARWDIEGIPVRACEVCGKARMRM
jgi:hypothetical protein